MRTVWNITTYLMSDMPLTSKVSSVFSVSFVVIQDDEPTQELVESLVRAHTRNASLLVSEVARGVVPDDIISDLH